MKVMVVDELQKELDHFENMFFGLPQINRVNLFCDSLKALALIQSERVDVVFLNMELQGMTSLFLAKNIRAISPDTNIIFYASDFVFVQEAFDLRVSGYLLKPIVPQQVYMELENLRYPVAKECKPKLFVRAFGNFELFYDNQPVKFRYSKTKELFAFLVDRKGALCSNREIMAILWAGEDVGKRSYFSNLVSDLTQTLLKIGHEDVIQKQRGKLAIMPEKIICDYYDWLHNLGDSTNPYDGEYMSQYDWKKLALRDTKA